MVIFDFEKVVFSLSFISDASDYVFSLFIVGRGFDQLDAGFRL